MPRLPPTRPERLLGFVDEVADAPSTAGRRCSRRSAPVRGPGSVTSGLALDGELVQMSAFAVEDEPRGDGPGAAAGPGRIARPSRRRD